MNSDVIIGAIIVFVLIALMGLMAWRVQLINVIRQNGKKDIALIGVLVIASIVISMYTVSRYTMLVESNNKSYVKIIDKLAHTLFNENELLVRCFYHMAIVSVTYVVFGVVGKKISDRILKNNSKISLAVFMTIVIKGVYSTEWTLQHMIFALVLAFAVCTFVCVYHKLGRCKYIYPVLCVSLIVAMLPSMECMLEVALVVAVNIVATLIMNFVLKYTHYLRDLFKYVVDLIAIVLLVLAENVICNLCL